jgi:glutathione synthase
MPKALSLAVVMDPIAKIKFAKDSTLAMLLAAAARGWKLTYFEQSDLFLRDGVALGHGKPLEVHDDSQRWFELGATSVHKLGDFDCVLMRKDPPFDAEYIYSSYILERAELQGAVANRPQGLRMNEKVHGVVPAVLRSHAHLAQQPDITAFATEHGKIVEASMAWVANPFS